MQVLFPMAGQGARFGHRFKPFLSVGTQTFIEAAVAPFRAFAGDIEKFVFVYLAAQEREFDVRRRLEQMFTGLPISTVCLEAPTRGPAETIARGIAHAGTVGEVMLCDCDHALDVTPLFARAASPTPWSAVLPVWPLAGESLASWSVAMVEDGRVHAIAEKRMPEHERGTPMGVIGCYVFRDVRAVVDRAHALGATNFSDVLRAMLADGEDICAEAIQHARFFGDPERLARATKGQP